MTGARRHLPLAPLARLLGDVSAQEIHLRTGVSVRTVNRMRMTGYVTIRIADQLCVGFGLHPRQVWEWEWDAWEAEDDQPEGSRLRRDAPGAHE